MKVDEDFVDLFLLWYFIVDGNEVFYIFDSSEDEEYVFL